jgi:hypothetical protein
MEDEGHSSSEAPAVPDKLQATHSGEVANSSSAGHLAPSNSNLRPATTKKRIPRPLSWLPTPRYRRNKVGRSISAPVLTSTTNVNVARVEGVRCGELTPTDLIQSTWDPQVGWISESAGMAEHNEKAATAAQTADEIEERTMGAEIQLKCDTGKPTNTAFSRLKGIIRGHLDTMTVARRPSIAEKTQFSKLEEDSISSTARRRAEAISLCRQKIRNLTGHGNVKRKPIVKANELSAKNIGERHHEEQPLLMPGSTGSPGKLDVNEAYPTPSHDYTFGDLEKSFMNTLDKLDFHQTPQQTPVSMANPKRQSLLPGLYRQDPKMTQSGDAATVSPAGIHTSRPEPCTFSVSKASLVLTPTIEPRPKVNPLKCHPNVTGFAEQAVDPEISTPPQGTSTPRIEITKEEVEDLQTAPIYSPSSGNLSQYARLTPSPARSTASSFHTAPLLTPGNLNEIPYYTPTRSSGRNATAEYAAHQRKGETAARWSNPQQFSDYQQARVKENRKITNPTASAMKNQRTPTEGRGGAGTQRESRRVQQNAQASSADGQDVVPKESEETQTLGWSPYRLGSSKRIVGWAPLSSPPNYRCASQGRAAVDGATTSDEHPRSTE